ncbi:MAG: DUF4234 domain-containing protein [Candidatus Obscuribacter sp.]|nr:DUF4234 domain-containing protein [Candidatus Obscuribacter sp.]
MVKEVKTAPKQAERDSRQIPAWHIVVLSVVTLGIYNLYWFYKTLSQLKTAAQIALEVENPGAVAPNTNESESDRAVMDELRNEARTALSRLSRDGSKEVFLAMHKWPVGMYTLLFAIPMVNLLALMRLVNQFCLLQPGRKEIRENSRFLAFALSLGFGASVLLLKLPFMAVQYKLITYFAVTSLFLSVAQSWLNQYWKVYEADKLLVRQAFNPLEILLIVLGASFIGLLVVSLDVLPKLP